MSGKGAEGVLELLIWALGGVGVCGVLECPD